jgi:citrate lyase subunit beta/citryl-CoA lyase
MEKAKTLPADAVILDLEDAVAPDAKTDARDAVLAAVGDRAYGAREVLIRVNGLDTGWGRDDLAMAASAGVDGVVVPKVTRGKDVRAVDRYLKKAGASPDLGLWVMIETPLAVLNIKKIAKASAKTRLTGFVMGTNDLAREYQAVPTPDRLAFLFWWWPPARTVLLRSTAFTTTSKMKRGWRQSASRAGCSGSTARP